MAGWSPQGGFWGPSNMVRAFHEAVGVSFLSTDPQKCMDALLYGLTMSWDTKVTSFNLNPDAAAVSFPICNVVSKEPTGLEGRKYASATKGSRMTPKKQAVAERGLGMAIDDKQKGDHGNAGTATCTGSGVAGDDDEGQQEMTHKEPNYKNAG